MKRLLARVLPGLLLCAPLRPSVAEEQMLYWMIDGNNTIEFEYAVVYAAKTDDLSGKAWTVASGFGNDVATVALPKEVLGGLGYEAVAESWTTMDILTELGETNWAGYSFYIELLQWDAESEAEIRKGVSEVSSYNDLLKNNHILGGGLTIPSNLVVWSPTTSVPEPTAGLLLCLGLAALALKRPLRVCLDCHTL